MCKEPEYEYDITFYPQTGRYVWTVWSINSGKFLTGGSESTMIRATDAAEAAALALERT